MTVPSRDPARSVRGSTPEDASPPAPAPLPSVVSASPPAASPSPRDSLPRTPAVPSPVAPPFPAPPAPSAVAPPPPPRGLSALPSVVLDRSGSALLAAAVGRCGGPTPWRLRKEAEARDLLALAQIAPPGRLGIEVLDLEASFRTVLSLRVPVPLRPLPDGDLPVAGGALLGLTYPLEAVAQPFPGFAFLEVLSPAGVWHSNVSEGRGQALCLGAQLPAGIPIRELVLLAYGALCLQTVTVDENDPAGVLNLAAAHWWQQNLHRAPLTTTPFLSPDGAGAVRPGARTGLEDGT